MKKNKNKSNIEFIDSNETINDDSKIKTVCNQDEEECRKNADLLNKHIDYADSQDECTKNNVESNDEYVKTSIGGKKAELIRTIKYLLCAASAGLIQFGVTTLMVTVFHIDGKLYWVSYTVALILSVLWNFTFNRKFTFESSCNIPKSMLLVGLYYAVFGPVSAFGGDALTNLAHWHELATTAFFMIINGVTEFLYLRYFVFAKSINTARKNKKPTNQN